MKQLIHIKEILPKVLHVTIKDQYKLGMTFVRIQEFYESPEFKNTYFTLENYIDWYASVDTLGNGDFTYTSDWSGYNFDGGTIKKWIQVCIEHQDQLRPKEVLLLKTLKTFIGDFDKIDQYYIIGTTTSSSTPLDHEIAHALYTLNPVYKEACDRIMKAIPPSIKHKIKETLLASGGYCEDVVLDETQAYLATSDYICNTSIIRLTKNVKTEYKIRDIKKLLEENFKSFKKSLT